MSYISNSLIDLMGGNKTQSVSNDSGGGDKENTSRY